MPKRLNIIPICKTLNLRSSTNNNSTLGTKHIKKFKFRGSWNTTAEQDGKQQQHRNTNIGVSELTLRTNRKRKMAGGRSNSLNYKNKMAKLDLSDEIQHQINDQIRMREGAMKLMSACSTLNQALETSKNLLTINARILGLMSALQRKKKATVLQEYNRQRTNSIPESPEDACMGRVAISDMRIPLMWKDNVHFTGKTGDQSYYAFALIRCGGQVRDTPLYEITSADTDMYFDLTIVFEELHPDFKMDFEVYYTVISSNEAHGIRTPIRTTMNLRTPRKTVHFNAPKFCLAGHSPLSIDDVRVGIISKDLTMGGKGASGVAVLGDLHEFPIHPLELWGQICFQLAAQPKGIQDDVHKGCVNIEINSPMNEYFCILRQNFIHCWESEATTEQCKPVHSMKLEPGLKVIHLDQGADVNSIQLANKDASVLATLKFSTSTDCFDWKCAIRKQMNNIMSWKNAFGEQMHIQEMTRNRLSVPSNASFYDQIEIEEISNDSNNTHVTKANDHDIINGESDNTSSVFYDSDSENPQSSHTPALKTTPTESTFSKEDTPSQNLITPNTDTKVEAGKSKICENASNNTLETQLSSNIDPSNQTAEDQDPNLSTPEVQPLVRSDQTIQLPQRSEEGVADPHTPIDPTPNLETVSQPENISKEKNSTDTPMDIDDNKNGTSILNTDSMNKMDSENAKEESSSTNNQNIEPPEEIENKTTDNEVIPLSTEVEKQTDSNTTPSPTEVNKTADSDTTPSVTEVEKQTDSNTTPSPTKVNETAGSDTTPSVTEVEKQTDGVTTPSTIKVNKTSDSDTTSTEVNKSNDASDTTLSPTEVSKTVGNEATQSPTEVNKTIPVIPSPTEESSIGDDTPTLENSSDSSTDTKDNSTSNDKESESVTNQPGQLESTENNDTVKMGDNGNPPVESVEVKNDNTTVTVEDNINTDRSEVGENKTLGEFVTSSDENKASIDEAKVTKEENNASIEAKNNFLNVINKPTSVDENKLSEDENKLSVNENNDSVSEVTKTEKASADKPSTEKQDIDSSPAPADPVNNGSTKGAASIVESTLSENASPSEQTTHSEETTVAVETSQRPPEDEKKASDKPDINDVPSESKETATDSESDKENSPLTSNQIENNKDKTVEQKNESESKNGDSKRAEEAT